MSVAMTKKQIETMLGAFAVTAAVVRGQYEASAEVLKALPFCKLDDDTDDHIEALKLKQLGLVVIVDSEDPDRETYPWKLRLTAKGFGWVASYLAGSFFNDGDRKEVSKETAARFFAVASDLLRP